MRESAGEANITIIVIVLIGVVAAVGSVLIPRLVGHTVYASCCTQAGGKWSQSKCSANTPITCEEREKVWTEFEDCVKDNGRKDASTKYKSVECEG